MRFYEYIFLATAFAASVCGCARNVSGDLPQDDMQVMDLVFFNWRGYNPSFDHGEAYIGGNQLIGHGGPGKGPTVKQDANAYARGAHDWRVRRYV